MTAIVLTDPPEVVALKREFYTLDGRKEAIKPMRHASAAIRRQLERFEIRQREIVRAIALTPEEHGWDTKL